MRGKRKVYVKFGVSFDHGLQQMHDKNKVNVKFGMVLIEISVLAVFCGSEAYKTSSHGDSDGCPLIRR